MAEKSTGVPNTNAQKLLMMDYTVIMMIQDMQSGKERKKDEFKANKKKNKTATAGNTSNSSNNNNSNTNGRSFKLTDKLKTALCIQGQMTPEQVEEILGQDFP